MKTNRIVLNISIMAVVVAAFLVFTKSVHAQGTNLVQNGGFETGNLNGWTVTGDSTFLDPTTTFTSNGVTYKAYSGNDFLAMGPVDEDASITQNIATVIGNTYDISFEMAADGDSPSNFSTQFGGTTLFTSTNTPAQPYTLYNYIVKATSASSALTFTARNDPGYYSLDCVTVSTLAAPEPSAWIAIVIAFFGLGLLVLRARRESAEDLS